ncbi:transcriptional activator, TenA family [Sulfolobus islandicus Y.G.57.14]|jgi:thiaminase|uniref:TENA/THI-4 domain protein n=5 Tax=Saccharolobus islandicus TaxID=43080 RepID=C3MLH6_SACI2|nr:TenA family transcriptional regulator [Sulfolobus islandicus]ACP34574.1 TENA/THI-4 domain protein [Sulfolobus islandicus L.S.2.15]ACP44699.1 transcriptional activator, TenA family [Sulfolobus islandicus Y.G.57.14]ACP49540.1 transcriptional activator, TenA family [Sulfolobus islandicus Y.N.15.51]ADX82213.1 transcriptional activator, TenA family [Sulfolobus islandicus HVE10/4]ADX84569.1 transcriptional activator, TenA family [Sulfolobus islandicus REY15A]
MNILEQIRKELEGLNGQIINHPLLKEKVLRKEVVNSFVINQWYIVNHDLRSLAIGLSKSTNMEELDIFKILVDGDYAALKELVKLMNELGIEVKDPLLYNVSPQAISYTHYLSWLANYAKPSEFLFAGIVNLPVWANVVTRFGDMIKERFGIRETGFFDAFRGSYKELEDRIVKLVEDYQVDRLRRIAYTIQYYEKSFWDSIYVVHQQ